MEPEAEQQVRLSDYLLNILVRVYTVYIREYIFVRQHKQRAPRHRARDRAVLVVQSASAILCSSSFNFLQLQLPHCGDSGTHVSRSSCTKRTIARHMLYSTLLEGSRTLHSLSNWPNVQSQSAIAIIACFNDRLFLFCFYSTSIYE